MFRYTIQYISRRRGRRGRRRQIGKQKENGRENQTRGGEREKERWKREEERYSRVEVNGRGDGSGEKVE